MRVKLLHMKQLNTALKTATSSLSFSICQVILGGKCAQAGINRDRSGLVENTVPFDIRKFRKFKPGILVEQNAPYMFPLLIKNYQFVPFFLLQINRIIPCSREMNNQVSLLPLSHERALILLLSKYQITFRSFTSLVKSLLY